MNVRKNASLITLNIDSNEQRNLFGLTAVGGQQFVRRTAHSGETILCTLPLGT